MGIRLNNKKTPGLSNRSTSLGIWFFIEQLILRNSIWSIHFTTNIAISGVVAHIFFLEHLQHWKKLYKFSRKYSFHVNIIFTSQHANFKLIRFKLWWLDKLIVITCTSVFRTNSMSDAYEDVHFGSAFSWDGYLLQIL